MFWYLNLVTFLSCTCKLSVIWRPFSSWPLVLELYSYLFSCEFSWHCTCPLNSSCSHRPPTSQHQTQRRLQCVMYLPPPLQGSQKWVVTVHSHLLSQSQKMQTKRMSLGTAGVSCLFTILIIRSLKIALGLFCMNKYFCISDMYCSCTWENYCLFSLNTTCIPEAWVYIPSLLKYAFLIKPSCFSFENYSSQEDLSEPSTGSPFLNYH